MGVRKVAQFCFHFNFARSPWGAFQARTSADLGADPRPAVRPMRDSEGGGGGGCSQHKKLQSEAPASTGTTYPRYPLNSSVAQSH